MASCFPLDMWPQSRCNLYNEKLHVCFLLELISTREDERQESHSPYRPYPHLIPLKLFLVTIGEKLKFQIPYRVLK